MKIQLLGGPKAGASVGVIACEIDGISDSDTFGSYKLPAIQTTLPTITGRVSAGSILTASTTGLTGVTNYSWEEVGPGSGVLQSGASDTFDTTGQDDKVIELVVTCDQGVLTSPGWHIYTPMADQTMRSEDEAGPLCVPHNDATHITAGSGDWLAPSTWLNGNVPKDGARVLVAYGHTITYTEGTTNVRMDWLRLDGAIRVAQSQSTRLMCEHIVITRKGDWENGLGGAVLPAQYTHERVHSNRNYRIEDRTPTDLDKSQDLHLIGRGFVNYGRWEEWGAQKDHYITYAPANAPMATDTTVTLDTAPTGWEVGDEIVIPWTRGTSNTDRSEKVVITDITGAVITFTPALVYDHDHGIPGVTRQDLLTPVINLTRNIKTMTENGVNLPAWQRAHCMTMHPASQTQVWGVQVIEMGRSVRLDESKHGTLRDNAGEADEFYFVDGATGLLGTEPATAQSNIVGRYSLHSHKTGHGEDNEDTFAFCSVDGNPGWGMTHHDSKFRMNSNVTFRVAGCHMAGEVGNEDGEWIENVYVNNTQKAGNFLKSNDQGTGSFGASGYGSWNRGRAVKVAFNWAVDCGYDFLWFHRNAPESISPTRDPARRTVDLSDLQPTGSLRNYKYEDVPIINMVGNKSIGTWKQAIAVTKPGPNHNHGAWIIMRDHFAWSNGGAEGWTPEYISMYSLIDSTFVGYYEGIRPLGNTHAISVVNCETEACSRGVAFGSTSVESIPEGLYNNTNNSRFTLTGHTYTNCTTDFFLSPDPKSPPNDDPANDIRFDVATPPIIEVSTDLPFILGNQPDKNTYDPSVTSFTIFDSLAPSGYPRPQNLLSMGLPVPGDEVEMLVRKQDQGYWNVDGSNTLVVPLYFSDRLDGRVIKRSYHGITLQGDATTGFPFRGTRDTAANVISNAPCVFNVAKGGSQIIDVVGLCSDQLGDTLSLAKFRTLAESGSSEDFNTFIGPNSGRFEFSGNFVIYTPVPSFTGTDYATLWVDDEHWNTHRVDVSITVT